MKKFFLTTLIAIGGITSAQSQNVGINKDAPEATLDIKGNDVSKVLRVSTIPSDLSTTSTDYVFFLGEKVNNGYNLRKMTMQELAKKVISEIPSLKRVVVKNNAGQTFRSKQNTTVNLDTEIVNTATDLYGIDTTTKSITIKQEGIYDVTSWIGFQELRSYNGDIVISLAKAPAGSNTFSNFKRTIISRTGNNTVYNIGNGVGVSFSFTEAFKAGDKIRLQVVAVDVDNISTLAGSVNMTVARTK